MKITKVKRHATGMMVEEGKVKAAEKEGNDKADEAADEGATKSQGMVRKFAELYSWRHGLYRKLMTRIQRFIVEVKKEEKNFNQEDDKKKDPFQKKEAKQIKVPDLLEYVEEGEVVNISMHEIKKEWCDNKEEWKYTNGSAKRAEQAEMAKKRK